jgi:hypothetical protein
MTSRNDGTPVSKQISRTRLVASARLDGDVFELVYDGRGQTALARGCGGAWEIRPKWPLPGGGVLRPIPARNNLIRHGALLLPSEPEEYGDDQRLLAEIQRYVHRYVDVSSPFEALASYYVLLSWLYDAFAELPYLRLRGDYGSGKTRFLVVVGAICYRPFFASGASTISPIFHTLDCFRGTLVMDEADFRFSDEKAEIAKILNNGNMRGMPVLRSVAGSHGQYEARAFHIFGPKLIATRGYYEDRALESRFLSEDMGRRPLRDDVPLNLPDVYQHEALRLRNKLLLFRLRNIDAVRLGPEALDPGLDPRINQLFAPLVSLAKDQAARDLLRGVAWRSQNDLDAERAMDPEPQLLEIIRDVMRGRDTIPLKELVAEYVSRHGNGGSEQRVSSRWIGTMLRRRLGLQTHKSHGNFVVRLAATAQMELLYRKFGLDEEALKADLPDSRTTPP